MIKDKLLGRQSYTDILNKRAIGLKDNYRQNIAIIGDEASGKTSIVFNFLSKFSDNRIIALYLEVRPEAFSSFAKRFMGVLLYNFLLNSGMPLKEDLDFLIKKSSRFIPKTAEKMSQVLSAIERRKKNNVFTDLLSLCELFHLETGKSCVVILDEFHNLESLGINNLYTQWSKLLISQKNTMYIIISSLKFKTRAILSKDLSLLFGNFEVINVEPFDIGESGEYLLNALPKGALSNAHRDFIIHFTGGYPFYLEVIADAVNSCPMRDFPEILEGLLFDSSGALNQRFSNYIKRFPDPGLANDYISVLYLIASGRNKVRDIAHILRIQKKDLALRLGRLLELDAITRSGDFLKINDRVFGFWLKFVYQEKLSSLTFDAKHQKEKFRESIAGMISEFELNSLKTVPERLSELLQLFGDETMQVERKRIKLSHFREIKPLEINNSNIKCALLGRSNDSLWIMAFKHDLLTEEDIAEFSRECKKYRHKLQRKIIITFKDIEANTRLRALEEKIWAWDINRLNQMFDLYSKPWVIA